MYSDLGGTGHVESQDPGLAGVPVYLDQNNDFVMDRWPGKKPDDDERYNDGRRRAEQIERQRQAQVIALAEAMGMGGDRERASPG